MKREILGVVMAGGLSSRMGDDKAQMELRPGQTQLDYAFWILDAYCQRLACSVGDAQKSSIQDMIQIFDDPLAAGPMAGVLASLRISNGTPVFVLACDMPFVERSIVLQLLQQREDGYLATCYLGEDGFPEPLCTLYEASALPVLEERARRGEYSLRHFLKTESVKAIPLARPDCLASVNTPEQARVALARLSEPS